MMKKLLFTVLTFCVLWVLVACGGSETVYVEVISEAEIPTMRIHVGETFHADIQTIISNIGASEHMRGRYFYISNLQGEWDALDGWALSIGWRTADNFFGNPPENWADATEFERNEYFIDYLIDFNILDPNHEIEEVTFQIFFPEDGAYPATYVDHVGRMVQFQRHGMHTTNIAIEFYSYSMQYDDEGAFFILFNNYARDEDSFNENQAIFEQFLNSITLWRFHQHN
ncbi:MAG: hypothetical protein FWE05_10555 [Defluviitaleaceae bacterium]|nr:hypothetical protein [Defluviitaleaceae bacterium]